MIPFRSAIVLKEIVMVKIFFVRDSSFREILMEPGTISCKILSNSTHILSCSRTVIYEISLLKSISINSPDTDGPEV